MRGPPACDLSVIIPFTDDEDAVGALVGRLAAHLRALGLGFEILAVDEGSGDNSRALLALVRERTPELVLLAARSAAGFATGAQAARGRALLLWDAAVRAPVGPVGWACRQVSDDRADLVLLPGRFAVCRRTRAWHVLARTRGRGAAFERRLQRRALASGLRTCAPVPALTAARGR
jgi:hypothetical protein